MREVALILHKDMLIEWRSRAQSFVVLSFALVILLLFSFAIGPDIDVLRAHAPAYTWLALLLTSSITLSESFRREFESDAVDGLRLLPIAPSALFYGKALANTVVLTLVALLTAPIVIALFDVQIATSGALLPVVVCLGCAGIAGPGTLYAAITGRAQGREVLLPILLFPLLVPALLAAVKATTLLVEGDPMGQVRSWLSLLLSFDVLFWSLSGLLFGQVIEE